MSARAFDSIISSPLGAAVKSPLNARETGGGGRAVYLSSVNFRIVPPGGGLNFTYDEKLFRLSLDDLSSPLTEKRPPWWPSPHPDFGQTWTGMSISGDAETAWYTAANLTDLYRAPPDGRWTIDIYKLRSDLTSVDSWRWDAPGFGGGHMTYVAVFGTSEVLWGLGLVRPGLNPFASPTQVHLLELDPVTMEIRRSSSDLWSGLTPTQRAQRPFLLGGGGTSSRIWIALTFLPDSSTERSIILEYRPSDFSLIRQFDAPRSQSPPATRRIVQNLGGDDESIWISSRSEAFGNVPGNGQHQTRISELPSDFSDENRTILQDDIVAPWPYPFGIG